MFAFLQTWLSWLWLQLQNVILGVLAAGPIPRHIAFVMDGNRRYARQKGYKVQVGHSEGFATLQKILGICLKLNVRCVSVYAFAINNFKRPKEEVDALMALAEEKLVKICEHGELLDEYGVRLNVLGDTALLPAHVQDIVTKAENMTRQNDKAILNIHMPYASRHEITMAVQAAVNKSLDAGEGDDPQITEQDIEDQLMTSRVGSPPLDILVRTSGVKRLSDYLLWQCCENTQIHFVDTYWPDFGLWDFIPILLEFQQKIWAQERTTKKKL